MKLFGLLLLSCGFLLIGAAPAGAHTDLIRSSPAVGASVGGDVHFVDLVFGEPISGLNVVVIDPSGQEVSGQLNVDEGAVALYTLDESISESGRYEVSYTMTSFDNDFTEREFFFIYDESSAQPFRFAPDGSIIVEPAGRNWLSLISTVLMISSVVGVALLVLHRQGVFSSSTMLESEAPDVDSDTSKIRSNESDTSTEEE